MAPDPGVTMPSACGGHFRGCWVWHLVRKIRKLGLQSGCELGGTVRHLEERRANPRSAVQSDGTSLGSRCEGLAALGLFGNRSQGGVRCPEGVEEEGRRGILTTGVSWAPSLHSLRGRSLQEWGLKAMGHRSAGTPGGEQE